MGWRPLTRSGEPPLQGTTPELVARVKCLLVGPVSLVQSNIQNTNQHPGDSQH